MKTLLGKCSESTKTKCTNYCIHGIIIININALTAFLSVRSRGGAAFNHYILLGSLINQIINKQCIIFSKIILSFYVKYLFKAPVQPVR